MVVLAAGGAQGDLVEEALPAADAGEAVLLDGAALEAEEDDQIGQRDDGAVEQQGAQNADLHDAHHQDQRDNGPDDPNHVRADAFPVADVADDQHDDLDEQGQIANPVVNAPVVVAGGVKVEKHAVEQVPDRQPGVDQHHRGQADGCPAQAMLVVHILQHPMEQVKGDGAAQQNVQPEIQGIQPNVDPEGDDGGFLDGVDAQDIQRNGGHGQTQAAPVQRAANGAYPAFVVEEQYEN